jgi:hypothetical protein
MHAGPRPSVGEPHDPAAPTSGGLNTDLLNTDLPSGPQRDPENRLLHHFPRRRLDFEALRDALLAASGKLDLTTGGQPVDILATPFSGRRTVYGFIDRQNLPGVFRTFDLANPDVSSPGRFTTTVPQQALFMMNSPFVLEQARAMAAWAEAKQSAADDRIRAVFARTLQRVPEPGELELVEAFLARPASSSPQPDQPSLTPLEQFAQVLLLSNEFAFVD